MDRFGGFLSCILPAILLAGCTSAVVSQGYDPAKAADGLVYHLPKTKLALKATYELTCQSVKPGATAGERVAKLELVDLAVTPRTVPDDDAHAYVIDPAALSSLTTSVNPARFEFQNGILKAVTFKPKSEIGPTLTEAVKLAANLLPLGGVLSLDAKSTAQEALYCGPELMRGPVARVDALAAAAEKRQAALTAADAALQRTPSEGRSLAVANAEKRLDTAKAALKATREGAFRRTVELELEPTRDQALTVPPGEGLAGRSCNVTVEPKDRAPLDAWLQGLVFGPAGKPDPLKPDKIQELICLTLATDIKPEPGRDATAPGEAGYPGIYYRRGVTGSVWVRHEPSAFERRFERIPILHFGPTARLELKNGAFESRGFALAFDDSGQLTSYEATSTAAAKDALATAAALPQTIADAEKAQLQREIDLLTKRKELLAARKALDEAEGG